MGAVVRDAIYAAAFVRAWERYRNAPQRFDLPEPGQFAATPVPHTPESLRAVCEAEARECVACWEATS